MEPVTHMLTGACLSRTGLNRTTAYATLTMVIAAELPDIDTLWSLRGPVEGFQHHRGITHTFLGLPFEAAVLIAAVYGWHRWRVVRQRKERVSDEPAGARPKAGRKPLTVVAPRWGVLYGLVLVALLSHLMLDYTNNYGLRPFFPFNDRWYEASIVFIFDPVIFVLLLAALIAPWFFGLIGSEVGAKQPLFRGRGWAIAALVGVVAWWTLREVEHGRAVNLAMGQSITAPAPPNTNARTTNATDAPAAETLPVYLSAQRVLASPDPLSPFRWSAAMDFGSVYQLGEIDTRNGSLTMGETTYPKPGGSAAILAAERSSLGRVYMDWSAMPILDVTRPQSEPAGTMSGDPGAAGLRVVTFRDPRFMGGWMRDTHRSALTGTVSLDTAGAVVRQTMDGRVEK
jgi:inner membrane protein